MSIAMPGHPGSRRLQTITDSIVALKDRLSRTRPAGPSQDRVRRYLETGNPSVD